MLVSIFIIYFSAVFDKSLLNSTQKYVLFIYEPSQKYQFMVGDCVLDDDGVNCRLSSKFFHALITKKLHLSLPKPTPPLS